MPCGDTVLNDLIMCRLNHPLNIYHKDYFYYPERIFKNGKIQYFRWEYPKSNIRQCPMCKRYFSTKRLYLAVLDYAARADAEKRGIAFPNRMEVCFGCMNKLRSFANRLEQLHEIRVLSTRLEWAWTEKQNARNQNNR